MGLRAEDSETLSAPWLSWLDSVNQASPTLHPQKPHYPNTSKPGKVSLGTFKTLLPQLTLILTTQGNCLHLYTHPRRVEDK